MGDKGKGEPLVHSAESLTLEFPDAPDFISRPPSYTLAEMIQICEKMLPYWNEVRYRPGSPYLEPIVMEEFVLHPMEGDNIAG